MKTCRTCGRDLEVIKDKPYKYDECGLDVQIIGLNQFVCKTCDVFFVSIPKIKELHRVIGGIVCSKNKGLLNGKEIKFLRKDLHLKAKDFAKMLGVTPQTVSKWENNNKKIGEKSDRLLRSIYLLYASEQANHVVCHGVVRMFTDLPIIRKTYEEGQISLNPPDWTTGIPHEFCPS